MSQKMRTCRNNKFLPGGRPDLWWEFLTSSLGPDIKLVTPVTVSNKYHGTSDHILYTGCAECGFVESIRVLSILDLRRIQKY